MTHHESGHPWQAVEEEAYHAYREWPLWLVLRERQLAGHLAAPPQPPAALRPAAEVADKTSHPALSEGGTV